MPMRRCLWQRSHVSASMMRSVGASLAGRARIECAANAVPQHYPSCGVTNSQRVPVAPATEKGGSSVWLIRQEGESSARMVPLPGTCACSVTGQRTIALHTSWAWCASRPQGHVGSLRRARPLRCAGPQLPRPSGRRRPAAPQARARHIGTRQACNSEACARSTFQQAAPGNRLWRCCGRRVCRQPRQP